MFFLNYSSELRRSRSWYLPIAMVSALAPLSFYDDYTVSAGLLNLGSLYSDYYTASSNTSMSDVHGLYLSYYVFNSFLLVLFGFFVFLVSVVCVLLLRASQSSYSESVGSILRSHKFFEEMLSFELLRVQNLSLQALRYPLGRALGRSPRG